MNREQLISYFMNNTDTITLGIAQMLADFIIEDRKRIVEPIKEVKEGCLYNFGRSGWIHHDNLLTKAIDATLKNAGIEQ